MSAYYWIIYLRRSASQTTTASVTLCVKEIAFLHSVTNMQTQQYFVNGIWKPKGTVS